MPPLNPPEIALGPAVPVYHLPQPLPAGTFGQVPVLSNPLSVPVADRDFAWDQLVDVVDDYFKIEREERVRQSGDILTEGRIETYPQTAATIFEPWRGDSVTLSDRWLCTLQTYRRRAAFRVIPEPQGFQIEVVVLKELEDVPRPSFATAGAATFRNDTSIERRTEAEPILGRDVGDDVRPVANATPTMGWIGQGRDQALERELLFRIQERMNRTNAAIRGGQLVPNPNSNPIFAPPPGAAVPGLLSPNGPETIPGFPPSGSHIGITPDPR